MTSQAVASLYDSWWDKPGDPRVAALARAKGWPPPLAWDDEALDDPDATHHQWAVRRPRVKARLHPDDVAELLALGCPRSEVAVRLGVTLDTVERAAARLSRTR